MKGIAFAAAFVLALSGTALAEPVARADHESAHAVAVQRAELDLAQSEDAALMLSRVQRAAARACDVAHVSRPDARLRRAMSACRADAIEQAILRIDQPEVTRLYLASAR